MRRSALVFGLLALAAVSSAQQRSRIELGVSGGAYFLEDKTLRDVFGDPALTFGLSPVSLGRPSEGRWTPSYSVIRAARGDSSFTLIPFTLGYERHYGDPQSKYVPYTRLEGGVAYYDVAIHDGSFNRSFKAGGWTAAAELGVVFNRDIALSVRYNRFQERSGINLSGIQVGLTFVLGGL